MTRAGWYQITLCIIVVCTGVYAWHHNAEQQRLEEARAKAHQLVIVALQKKADAFKNTLKKGCEALKGTLNSEQTCVTPESLINWRYIKEGSIWIGSDQGSPDESPKHRVTIKPFWMAQSEVTVEQYQMCVQVGVCTEPSQGRYCHWRQPNKDNYPVNCVQWKQALTYSQWVGGTLPSEAQWEYAARSRRDEFKYPWGVYEPTCEYAIMRSSSNGCGKDRVWPVCSKKKGYSADLLCDMAGSLWEWTLDEYAGSYKGAPPDGRPFCSEPTCILNNRLRVIRGGVWNNIATYLKSTRRHHTDQNTSYHGLGFRPVRQQ